MGTAVKADLDFTIRDGDVGADSSEENSLSVAM